MKPATTYSEKLRDPRWQRTRLEIMQRDAFACRLCGDKDSTLNVHHLHYNKGAEPWDYPRSSLVTTCETCHQELHAGKYGESILQSLIAGRATMIEITQLAERLAVLFDDGPEEGRVRLDLVRWNDFLFALEEVVLGLGANKAPEVIGDRVGYAIKSARAALAPNYRPADA